MSSDFHVSVVVKYSHIYAHAHTSKINDKYKFRNKQNKRHQLRIHRIGTYAGSMESKAASLRKSKHDTLRHSMKTQTGPIDSTVGGKSYMAGEDGI